MQELEVEVFRSPGYDCNVYLLDREVIIDAGTGFYHLVFMDWINERTDPEGIHTLILSHRHFDHTGGAVDILRDTGTTAYIHELDAPPVLNGDNVTTGARTFGGEQEPITVVQIPDEHVFDINGHKFRMLHTPGHTIGSIALWSEKEGIVFSGDTIFANGGIGRWDLATGDHDTLEHSISLLANLEIKDLYPGHDIIVKGNGSHHAGLALESIRLPRLELMMRRLQLIQK